MTEFKIIQASNIIMPFLQAIVQYAAYLLSEHFWDNKLIIHYIRYRITSL